MPETNFWGSPFELARAVPIPGPAWLAAWDRGRRGPVLEG